MKFKQVLFNIVVYAMLGWSIISAVHAALPEQYQIPEFTNMVALISGSSTALVGSAGLFIKSWLAKASTTADTKQAEIYEKFLILVDEYKGLKGQLEENKKLATEQAQESDKEIRRLIALVEADLKAKLSNKLIDKEVKQIISGVLENETENDL